MNQFLVVTNRQKDRTFACTNRVKGYLERHGKVCLTEAGDKALKIPAGTDCVIVLGGDGTLLRAARCAADAKVPLIGVNLGRIGYLAEVDSEELEEALKHLIQDDFTREKRMMLSGSVLPAAKKGSASGAEKGALGAVIAAQKKDLSGAAAEMSEAAGCFALNDIAITRKGSLQIIAFRIYVNGQLLHTCYADGILVATPTGSTGYNLSAGGPIVAPNAELILLTPICPHSIGSRTIVLSAQDEVVIEIGENKRGVAQEVEACFDGSVKMPMYAGDRMKIKKAEKATEMLKIRQDSFVAALRKKMGAE